MLFNVSFTFLLLLLFSLLWHSYQNSWTGERTKVSERKDTSFPCVACITHSGYARDVRHMQQSTPKGKEAFSLGDTSRVRTERRREESVYDAGLVVRGRQWQQPVPWHERASGRQNMTGSVEQADEKSGRGKAHVRPGVLINADDRGKEQARCRHDPREGEKRLFPGSHSHPS